MNTLTIDNKEYAVVEQAVFLQMQQTLENYQDSADIKQALLDVENGDDEIIPFEIVKKLNLGENKIKVWREYRKLSAAELAKKTKISPATISRIEGGHREPTLAQAKILAEVLGVDIDDLV
jgi:DNA-binding XRE family transcriptional regulator